MVAAVKQPSLRGLTRRLGVRMSATGPVAEWLVLGAERRKAAVR